MTSIKRAAFQSLNTWKNSEKRKPLILLGARQVGKSYLLQDFGRKSYQRCHIFDFEIDSRLSGIFEDDLDPARILRDLALYTGQKIDIDHDLVVFDEIQACGRALTSLKYFSEQLADLHLISTGSLLGVLLNDDSFPVGKVAILDLAPLSFWEFVEARRGNDLTIEVSEAFTEGRPISVAAHIRLLEELRLYTLIGGLPEVVARTIQKRHLEFDDIQEIRSIQRDLITAYLADMAKHCGAINSMHIERLWRNVPQQLARGVDGSSSKFVFKDVIPGIKGYERLAGALDWLVKARIIIRVPIVENALSPLSSQIHENTFKLYLFDVGLLNAMLNTDALSLLNDSLEITKGYIYENFVAQELFSKIPEQIFCWRNKESEVDFLIDHKGSPLPIEVKAGRRIRARSLTVFCKRYQPPKLAILSMNNVDLSSNLELRLPLYLSSRIAES
jgi:predicted AAA+ superfamily ATPase